MRHIVSDPAALAAMKAKIPSTDLVSAQYDVDGGMPTTDVLIVLSTPRGGSTWFCELLRVNGVCRAYEYFQPGQCRPIFADRWGCLHNGALDYRAYAKSLRRWRTSAKGWLGIHLHGSHLPFYERSDGYFTDTRRHYVHLVRRDTIAQAVSYHIAAQTGQWSSDFAVHGHATYSFDGIQKRLQRIADQNDAIREFLHARRAVTIAYEDMAADPQGTLGRLPWFGGSVQMTGTLKRQSDARSAEWARRFLMADGAPGRDQVIRASIWERMRRKLRRAAERGVEEVT